METVSLILGLASRLFAKRPKVGGIIDKLAEGGARYESFQTARKKIDNAVDHGVIPDLTMAEFESVDFVLDELAAMSERIQKKRRKRKNRRKRKAAGEE